jgi:predicted MPP superfamily phosphohydrolase
MVHDLGARYGAFASLGNHEYLHGIEVSRPAYERSPVPLLVASGRSLRIGRATMWIGGADDPVHMGGDIAWMLGPSIHGAMRGAPANADFRLLLCHRPEGFVPASDAGFDLTLSGHTHGGQLGFLGRSLMEKVRPNVFWWGKYARAREGRRGPSRLYTTSGFGHWFPFRLGCPTEMPLVVLRHDAGVAADVAGGARRGTARVVSPRISLGTRVARQ